jgi:hypothetical protein
MGGPGSGPKKKIKGALRDAIDAIDVEEIIGNLRDWAKGKEVVCPHCNRSTGAFTADTVALQSAIELLNRRLGKVPQSVQLDITQTIQLSADQIDKVMRNHLPQIVEIYKPEIMALLPGGEYVQGQREAEGSR